MDRARQITLLVIGLADALFLAAVAVLIWLQGEVREVAGVAVPTIAISADARVIIGSVAGSLALLSLIGAGLLMGAQRRPRTITINVSEGGVVRVPAANVEQMVAESVRTVPAVISATARATEAKAGMAVDVSVVLRPEAELPGTAEQISTRAEEVLAKRYGLALARKPRIAVRYAPAQGETRVDGGAPAADSRASS